MLCKLAVNFLLALGPTRSKGAHSGNLRSETVHPHACAYFRLISVQLLFAPHRYLRKGVIQVKSPETISMTIMYLITRCLANSRPKQSRAPGSMHAKLVQLLHSISRTAN